MGRVRLMGWVQWFKLGLTPATGSGFISNRVWFMCKGIIPLNGIRVGVL